MAMRFRKSVSLGKGVRVNFGKSSVGVSLGGKHGGVSVNSKTGVRTRASLPGTGISFVESLNNGSSQNSSNTNKSSNTKANDKPPRKRRGLLITICVLLFFGIVGACGDDEDYVVTTPEPTSTVEVITEKAMPTETPQPTQSQKPAAEPQPEKQIVAPVVPDNEVTKSNGTSSNVKSTPKPEPAKEVKQENTQEMVWIPTNGGSKYHSSASCSGMDNPDCVTIGEAKNIGFTPCKRCYG